jgi:hypothetical protein
VSLGGKTLTHRMRYVLEGEWTGYTSGHRRVVHRQVIYERRARRLKSLHEIVYTDGTSLILTLREARLCERVEEIHSYDELIHKAETKGGPRVLVADLLRSASPDQIEVNPPRTP